MPIIKTEKALPAKSILEAMEASDLDFVELDLSASKFFNHQAQQVIREEMFEDRVFVVSAEQNIDQAEWFEEHKYFNKQPSSVRKYVEAQFGNEIFLPGQVKFYMSLHYVDGKEVGHLTLIAVVKNVDIAIDFWTRYCSSNRRLIGTVSPSDVVHLYEAGLNNKK